MATSVVHCKKEKYDIYIGRGCCPVTGQRGPWGNPFSHKEGTLAKFKVNTREESIQAYREYIMNNPALLADLHKLKDKVLGCWCKPKDGFSGQLLCHGQILAGLLDGVPPESIE